MIPVARIGQYLRRSVTYKYSFVAVFFLLCNTVAQCGAASSIGRTQVIASPGVLNDKAIFILVLVPPFVHQGTLMRNSS